MENMISEKVCKSWAEGGWREKGGKMMMVRIDVASKDLKGNREMEQ
jgi:hypothetical protein